MTNPSKPLPDPSADTNWYLRLLADTLVIVTFCALAIALATSFALTS